MNNRLLCRFAVVILIALAALPAAGQTCYTTTASPFASSSGTFYRILWPADWPTEPGSPWILVGDYGDHPFRVFNRYGRPVYMDAYTPTGDVWRGLSYNDDGWRTVNGRLAQAYPSLPGLRATKISLYSAPSTTGQTFDIEICPPGTITPSPTARSTPRSRPTPTPTPGPFTISGMVTIMTSGTGGATPTEPVPGALLTLTGGDQTVVASSVADGTFVFDPMPAGKPYVLTPRKVGYQFTPAQAEFVLTGNKTLDFAARSVLYMLRGTVTDENNQPLVGALVRLTATEPTSFDPRIAKTNERGEFAFPAGIGATGSLSVDFFGYSFQTHCFPGELNWCNTAQYPIASLADDRDGLDFRRRRVTPEITKNLLVLVFDPLVTIPGTVPVQTMPLHNYYNWKNPVTIANDYVRDLTEASGGKIAWKIQGAPIVIPEWPPSNENPPRQYTQDTYIAAYNLLQQETARCASIEIPEGSGVSCKPSYAGLIFKDNEHYEPGEVKPAVNYKWIYDSYVKGRLCKIGSTSTTCAHEVLVGSYPYSGFWESRLLGKDPYFVNSPGLRHDLGANVPNVIMMNFNYGTPVEKALHNFGHRAESILHNVYGCREGSAWTQFHKSPACGTVHVPPNGAKDYDYNNPSIVASTCEGWRAYPTWSTWPTLTRNVSAADWANDTSGERGYMKWWLNHLPRYAGRDVEGKLADWWKYVVNFNDYTESKTVQGICTPQSE
jgi:hypothetical protein